MTDLVLEVKEALKDMVVSMGNLTKTTQGQDKQGTPKPSHAPDPESKDSLEEEANCQSVISKGHKKKRFPLKTSLKQKWY
jgi:hypothetical protein